ncbi:MAG: RDD family protein [Acidobacteria bacterium]|nr:RDD family protein [Acidobacteriota bacterium]
MAQKADNGKRIIAVIIDCIIAAILYIPFVVLSFIPVVGIIFRLIGFVAYLGYMGFRDALPIKDLQGASIGKRLMGLKAIQVDGQPCTYEQSFKRNLPFIAPAALSLLFSWIPVINFIASIVFGFVGLIIVCVELYKVMTDVNGQRIGDILANTRVIGVEAPQLATPAAAPPAAPPAPADLPPVPGSEDT